MSVTAVVGLQWGDEAKGKIVDLLTDRHDIVVRYLGGNNAGHTVVAHGVKYKLSLLPSGILHEGKTSVIAAGVVVNPKALLDEMAAISARGIENGRNLLISDRAHVIFPWHIAEEALLEKGRGAQAIGTTMRGIGTCYRDKAGRTHAIRMGDLLRPELLRERIVDVARQKELIFRALDPASAPLDPEAIYEEYSGYAERLRSHIVDTTAFLHQALQDGRSILFEGAQGSLLDIDHGTFPYVTSSNSSGCGIHSGSGVPERAIDRMIGVVKAYTTRVGGGPCPTELDNEIGQHIRDEGHEYGTVTGRPRRCGWFDAVATAYGGRISGVDSLAVMLLDVLSKLDQVQICEAYEIDGGRTTRFPSHVAELARARPLYRALPGWKCDISGARRWSDLPAEAQAYIRTIRELLDAPVEIVSVGPDREQTLHLDEDVC
jgi:adenylosuccinate synthase